MPWVKIDDHLDDHEKIGEVGPLGMALYVAGLCYCNRNLTDGKIKRGIARKLQDFSDHGGPQAVIASLLAAGLWVETDEGYEVHDYLEFQPSRDKVLKDREEAKSRMTRKRRSPDVPSEQPPNDAQGSQDVRTNNGRTGKRSSDRPGSRSPVPDLPGSANPSPPPEGGGEEVQQTSTRVMFTLIRDGFDATDLHEPLETLRRRLDAGEDISSPVEWTRTLAEKVRSKRLTAAEKRATENCETCDRTGYVEVDDPHADDMRVVACPDCRAPELVAAGQDQRRTR